MFKFFKGVCILSTFLCFFLITVSCDQNQRKNNQNQTDQLKSDLRKGPVRGPELTELIRVGFQYLYAFGEAPNTINLRYEIHHANNTYSANNVELGDKDIHFHHHLVGTDSALMIRALNDDLNIAHQCTVTDSFALNSANTNQGNVGLNFADNFYTYTNEIGAVVKEKIFVVYCGQELEETGINIRYKGDDNLNYDLKLKTSVPRLERVLGNPQLNRERSFKAKVRGHHKTSLIKLGDFSSNPDLSYNSVSTGYIHLLAEEDSPRSIEWIKENCVFNEQVMKFESRKDAITFDARLFSGSYRELVIDCSPRDKKRVGFMLLADEPGDYLNIHTSFKTVEGAYYNKNFELVNDGSIQYHHAAARAGSIMLKGENGFNLHEECRILGSYSVNRGMFHRKVGVSLTDATMLEGFDDYKTKIIVIDCTVERKLGPILRIQGGSQDDKPFRFVSTTARLTEKNRYDSSGPFVIDLQNIFEWFSRRLPGSHSVSDPVNFLTLHGSVVELTRNGSWGVDIKWIKQNCTIYGAPELNLKSNALTFDLSAFSEWSEPTISIECPVYLDE